MNNSFEIIVDLLKNSWTKPKVINNISIDMLFRCRFLHGINEFDNILFPEDFIEFYKISNGAYLFEDVTYGQWGLILLDLYFIRLKTEEFMFDNVGGIFGDYIVGEFIGDNDLLLLRLDKSKEDYGSIIIANRMDTRDDWRKIEKNFRNFIVNFTINEGQKYWE
ncbi:SMI1/KNR4 family protein [Acinetobacter bereziniae]|uniref:SMI1/KNR4 family protein n=1 Tax=Acinetobacter TaxID=469 RepID=UPI0005AA6A7A|nr:MULTISPECIES: SMI1/KNR4 family protein [Acinetobacter]ATZ64496.1 hypothetical protein BSR55_14645 [Acinetobacter bereziniae]MBJ8424119.1 SMI1/KNR4 family protein [Acinetobacter bereziniae]MBJ8452120.1 SMI1/KNR4 family protein [Acinetobacter bereziniae]MBJ8456100.1 SMI1/KNR4 family protein [Acinetobacter bereziniae]MBO3654332.1 SMI1/KNR4 family protein [Acinetobacter bereziniae]